LPAAPIIFLDFDGVLNSHAWWTRRGPRKPSDSDFTYEIDRQAVALLDEVVLATGALCVVSSSWRILRPLHKLQRGLRSVGFSGTLIGVTPNVWDRKGRGEEIERWLSWQAVRPVFAIVDDDSDMDPHKDRLVQTDIRVGLTAADAARLVALLGGRTSLDSGPLVKV